MDEDVPVHVVHRASSAIGASVVSVHLTRKGAEQLRTALTEDAALRDLDATYEVVEHLTRP